MLTAIPQNVMVPLNFTLEVMNTTSNIVIIVLSILYVKPNLCRTYALNHTIPSVVHSVYTMVLDFTDLTGYGREVFFKSAKSFSLDKKTWTSYIEATLTRFNANSYRVFATLMVLLTYISYTHPFFYSKLINKNLIFIFIGGYVLVFFSVGLVLPKSTISFFFEQSEMITSIDFATFIFYGEKFFGLIFLVAMIVLYGLSIYKIVQFSKKAQSSSASGKRRSQLVSVLVYCTPPNIFLILAMPRNFCIITQNTKLITGAAFTEMCDISRLLYSPSLTIRFLCSSVCTLIAFSDYRKIVVRGFQQLITGEVPSTTTVSVVSLNSPQTQNTSLRKTSTVGVART